MLNNMEGLNFEKINRDSEESDNKKIDEAVAAQLYNNPITDLLDRETFLEFGFKGRELNSKEKKLVNDFKKKTKDQNSTVN